MSAPADSGDLAGKVAFVTGAASGIGRVTALEFARRGAGVVVADIDRPGNRETATLIEDIAGRARFVHHRTCSGRRRRSDFVGP